LPDVAEEFLVYPINRTTGFERPQRVAVRITSFFRLDELEKLRATPAAFLKKDRAKREYENRLFVTPQSGSADGI
jgi:hypothetical protein